MLSAGDLRKVAARSGARDMSKVEIDVILTHILQRFHDKGLTEHLAFKGGTMLRKMVFGAPGRLSTDLDFTSRATVADDDLVYMLMDALDEPFEGISFKIEREKDIYATEEGCAANPICRHPDNENGVKIKIQVSTREAPILPVLTMKQLPQDHFGFLPFEPVAIPCIDWPEVVAEKIRAGSQRAKIRDLYDLALISQRPLPHDLIRPLAVLKLWNCAGPGLSYGRFRQRIEAGEDYEVDDLRALLRRNEKPDLGQMMGAALKGFAFLEQLTEQEAKLAADEKRQLVDEAAALTEEVRGRAAKLAA